MRTPIVAFSFGVLVLQQLPALPDARVLAPTTILVAFQLVLAVVVRRRVGATLHRTAVCMLALMAGFHWAAWRAEWRLAEALPMQDEVRDVLLTGVIDGLPQRLDGGSLRFVLRVEGAEAAVPGRIQLAWYPRRSGGAVELRPGERWQLVVRLKRPHGLHNPGGFDYEAWLLQRGIRATGYVREDARNLRIDAFVPGFMATVHRLRDDVRTRFMDTLGARPQAGVLIALAVGDQRSITQAQWDLFRHTAVGHLVAISGLHVSLVAVFAGGLAAWGWRRCPALLLRQPARRVGALVGLLAAAAYALLAGLGLPAQRALLMLTAAALALSTGRDPPPSHVLSLALLVVLVVDPWAVLSAGFWLSFGAVAVILWVLSGRAAPRSGLRTAVRVQLAITLALTPLLFALFGAFSLVGPFANAVAIPLVSFVIAPLVLAAILVPWPPLLWLAHAVADWMMTALGWFASLPVALWHGPAAPLALIVAAVVATLWLLLPRGTPAKPVAALAILPMLLWTPPRPEPGAFEATVLDVGQGLAVHVRTARHDLLYDAGPAYGTAADAGERVVVPYLRSVGVRALDAAVFSHGDRDHVGGAPSVFAALPVARVWVGAGAEPERLAAHPVTAEPCVAGSSWEWDGVRFGFLHPETPAGASRQRNEGSCVLRIEADGGRLLLTGDIGLASESALVARARNELVSDVVVAPHHGSRGASTPALVSASGAAHVIHSVGNLNSYRHPHPEVWARWAEAGARNWRTDGQGAILVAAGREGVSVASWRERAPRYWHGR